MYAYTVPRRYKNLLDCTELCVHHLTDVFMNDEQLPKLHLNLKSRQGCNVLSLLLVRRFLNWLHGLVPFYRITELIAKLYPAVQGRIPPPPTRGWGSRGWRGTSGGGGTRPKSFNYQGMATPKVLLTDSRCSKNPPPLESLRSLAVAPAPPGPTCWKILALGYASESLSYNVPAKYCLI